MFKLIFIFLCCGKFALHHAEITTVEPLEPSQFPYLLSMWNGKNHYCSATLISSEWALTSAQCIKLYSQELIYVRFQSNDCIQNGKLVKILDEFQHKHYNRAKSDYDIGILKLEKFDSNELDYIKLAECHSIPWSNEPTVEISGWGLRDIEMEENLKYKTQSIQMKLIDNNECYDKYKVPPYNFDVSSRMMCADYEIDKKPSDSCHCHGDIGGPVTYLGNLVGIVGTNYGCIAYDFPALFTNVSDYMVRTWVKDVTGISNC